MTIPQRDIFLPHRSANKDLVRRLAADIESEIWQGRLSELLSPTKLNWNSADFAARYPVTLAFSSRVGEILTEIPEDIPFREEYRFYM